jgi:MFS family permease
MTATTRGFVSILAAQFFSAVADNALLFAAIALLKSLAAPSWQVPVLQQSFAFAAIVLAPFVGPFADSLPKGRVMLVSNTLKMAGCLAMLLGLQPVVAYGCVGIGSAMYSPAKYGILSEYFPPERLVWANGWMEGLTVAAIILGAIVGGILTGERSAQLVEHYLSGQAGFSAVGGLPGFAIAAVLLVYLMATLCNLAIPKLPIDHALPKRTPWFLVKDFALSFMQLWRDPLGQVSLAVTTLFWGAGTTLRLIILTWGTLSLKLSLEQATELTAVVAVGIGVGAAIAGNHVPLMHAVKVLKTGIFMGLAVIASAFVSDWRIAIPLLLAIGMMGGYFVIPMNALLQHRGHRLMGAGHSIAVQNFNENLSILLMLGGYALMLKIDLSVQAIAVTMGLVLAGVTVLLMRMHGHDQDHGEI